MASGPVYRTQRPNTWLLRPPLHVKIFLANPEPSTHGPSRHIAPTSVANGTRRISTGRRLLQRATAHLVPIGIFQPLGFRSGSLGEKTTPSLLLSRQMT